jgi:aminopeptidase N
MWAADPNYTHTSLKRPDGLTLNFFYLKNERTQDVWAALPKIMDKAFTYINRRYGQYPYQQYSFVQGGDGGMEYPMATLITGNRSLPSLVGVSVHELMHSWYQMILGSNESLYPWMDEGFTDYATQDISNYLAGEGLIPNRNKVENPFISTYAGYFRLVSSGDEEPMSTHADHYSTNYAYGSAAYGKGAIFMNQMEYVIGKPALDKALLLYFNTWKFKHPNPNDVIRIMEKVSRLELDWYKEYWVNTTHYIDYGVDAIDSDGKETKITLKRLGKMPMPVDVEITYKSGKKELINIPLDIMRGAKPAENQNIPYQVAADWPWVNPSYELRLPVDATEIESVVIDPSARMADVNRNNNSRK